MKSSLIIFCVVIMSCMVFASSLPEPPSAPDMSNSNSNKILVEESADASSLDNENLISFRQITIISAVTILVIVGVIVLIKLRKRKHLKRMSSVNNVYGKSN